MNETLEILSLTMTYERPPGSRECAWCSWPFDGPPQQRYCQPACRRSVARWRREHNQ